MPLKSIGDQVNWQEHLASTVGSDKTRSHLQSCFEPSSNMRNTRQGTFALEEGDNVTIQQLMETIRALQQTVATSKFD